MAGKDHTADRLTNDLIVKYHGDSLLWLRDNCPDSQRAEYLGCLVALKIPSDPVVKLVHEVETIFDGDAYAQEIHETKK
jgi:hypothetical protein